MAEGEMANVKRSNKKKTQDLVSKEEEYLRLNAELEKRTISLVREAEEVLSGQERFLTKNSMLEKVSVNDFIMDDDDDDNISENEEEISARRKRIFQDPSPILRQSQTMPVPPSTGLTKPKTKLKKEKRPSNIRNVSSKGNDNKVDPLLTGTIKTIEDRLDNALAEPDIEILPVEANDIGTDAQIRFLKAKVRVMQEEVDNLAQDLSKKDEILTSVSAKLKEAEDEKLKLQRINAQQHQQIDKYKKLSEESKTKVDTVTNQLTSTKRELEVMGRKQKQQTSNLNSGEVRLNRALEEIEKYKAQVAAMKTNSKETADSDKKRLEKVLADNKRLERQKQEIITGFKKQMKLIDILRKMKLQVEAATVLKFTEEEFLKTLDWDPNVGANKT